MTEIVLMAVIVFIGAVGIWERLEHKKIQAELLSRLMAGDYGRYVAGQSSLKPSQGPTLRNATDEEIMAEVQQRGVFDQPGVPVD